MFEYCSKEKALLEINNTQMSMSGSDSGKH